MTNRIGGEVGELQNLEGTLRRRGQDIQGVRSELGNAIQNTWWVGTSADRFKDERSSQYAGMLQKLADDSFDRLRRRASDIEQAARARRLANPQGYVAGTPAHTANLKINNEEAQEVMVLLMLLLMSLLWMLGMNARLPQRSG